MDFTTCSRTARYRGTTSQTASLSTLPSELLLKIFRPLIPSKAHDNSKKVDLRNLRLTCKTLNPPATELFFESWPILRWQRDNFLEPTKSFTLLRENSSFAALVKDVVVKTVACSDTLILRLVAADYVSQDVFANRALVQSPPEPNITGELAQRLSIFVNITRIGLQKTSLSDVQFYNTFLAYVRAQGHKFEDDNLASKITDESIQDRCSRLHSWSITVVLENLPPKCKAASLDIRLESFARDLDIPALFSQDAHFKTQLGSLSVVIDEKSGQKDWASSRWCELISHFKSLTQLAIHASDLPLKVTIPWPQQETIITNGVLGRLHLPELKHLTLSQCRMHVSDFRYLSKAFPNLAGLEVEDATIMTPIESLIPAGKSTWLEIAQVINHDYNGRCTLSFGPSPILEIDSKLANIDLGYSWWATTPRWTIIRTLKTPALELLTAISRSERPSSEDVHTMGSASTIYLALEQLYVGLTEHTPPDVTAQWWLVDTPEPRSREIDTRGIKYMYYGGLYGTGSSYRGCPYGVHPLDWH